jgi:hypothetical protein
MLKKGLIVLILLVGILFIDFGLGYNASSYCLSGYNDSTFSIEKYDGLSLSFRYGYDLQNLNNYFKANMYWWDKERGLQYEDSGHKYVDLKKRDNFSVLSLCGNSVLTGFIENFNDGQVVQCPTGFQYGYCVLRLLKGTRYTQIYPWEMDGGVPILVGYNSRSGSSQQTCKSQGGLGLKRLSWDDWFNPHCWNGTYVLSSDENFCCVSDFALDYYRCERQGGDICAVDEVCLGEEMFSSDERCCSTQCVKESSLNCNTCSSCGNGLFNVCDEDECRNNCGYNDPSSCYFVSSGVGGSCFAKPAIEVTSCGLFRNPGRYILQNSVYSDEFAASNGYCLMAVGKDITIDLNGSNVYGDFYVNESWASDLGISEGHYSFDEMKGFLETDSCDGRTNPDCWSTSQGTFVWDPLYEPFYATGATSTNNGSLNTDILISIPDREYPAANACAELSEGGYDNWYLPASNELENGLNSQVLDLIELGFLPFTAYWSSTESDQEYAYYVDSDPYGAMPDVGIKDSESYQVRCLRGSDYLKIGGIFAVGSLIQIKDSNKTGAISKFDSSVAIYAEGSNITIRDLKISDSIVVSNLHGSNKNSLKLDGVEFIDSSVYKNGFLVYSLLGSKNIPEVRIINSKFSDSGFFNIENSNLEIDMNSFITISDDVSIFNSNFSLWTGFIGKRVSLTFDNLNFIYGMKERNNSFGYALSLSYTPKYGLDPVADVSNFPELDRPFNLVNEYMDSSLFSKSVRFYFSYLNHQNKPFKVPNEFVYLGGLNTNPFFNVVMNGFHFCNNNDLDCHNGGTCVNYKCVL